MNTKNIFTIQYEICILHISVLMSNNTVFHTNILSNIFYIRLTSQTPSDLPVKLITVIT